MKILEHKIEFEPAFDRRDPDPKKNYGIHGLTMKFLVIGKKGAIQFVIYTNWHLPAVQEWLIGKCKGSDRNGYAFCSLKPMAADIGYHSLNPQYEGQSKMIDNCPYLNDKPCYYDGSSLQAERYLDILIQYGAGKLWEELDARYQATFGGK